LITIFKEFSDENRDCNFRGTDYLVTVQCSILVPLEKGSEKSLPYFFIIALFIWLVIPFLNADISIIVPVNSNKVVLTIKKMARIILSELYLRARLSASEEKCAK